MSGEDGLPKGWAKAKVVNLVHLMNGCAFKPTDWQRSGLPIVRIQNLNNPDATFNYFPADELPSKFLIDHGDLLFAWSGTPGTSFGAHIWRGGQAWLNQHIFHVVFSRESLEGKFLQLAIHKNLDDYIRAAHGGAGLAHITKGRFGSSELLIAPLNEQCRIVAKIEERFSDLDAGVAALERAKTNLKRYRAAVLKAAVEGRQTEQWRAENPAQEPASKLLERILKQRRKKWEQDQLAAYEAKGKQPPKNWQAKYKEPTGPDTANLPNLPEGWCWATLETLSDIVGGITKDKKRETVPGVRQVPYLRVANVQREFLDLSEIKTIAAPEAAIADLALEKGDILFTEGGDRDKLGRGWVWSEELTECIHQNHVFRARLFTTDIQPKFVSQHGNTFGKEWFIRAGKQTTNLASINMGILRRFPIAIPPASEQREILLRLDEKLTQMDAAEQAIKNGLARAARLRQSILKRTFEGKLVPQDPNDEPASVLLERISPDTDIASGNDT